jgi:hypothetical protein
MSTNEKNGPSTKLTLSRETVQNLRVRSAVKTGAYSQLPTCAGAGCLRHSMTCSITIQ